MSPNGLWSTWVQMTTPSGKGSSKHLWCMTNYFPVSFPPLSFRIILLIIILIIISFSLILEIFEKVVRIINIGNPLEFSDTPYHVVLLLEESGRVGVSKDGANQGSPRQEQELLQRCGNSGRGECRILQGLG